MASTKIDSATLSELVAKHGSSSATAWLEFERYKLWQASEDIQYSDFKPVQGYMQKEPYAFAWGNPLVSSPKALSATARSFITFTESQGLKPIWCCVDRDLEEVLGSDEFNWSTVSCIYEDIVDPEHVIELTSPEAKGQEGVHAVKDLKRNLGRAEKQDVHVSEVRKDGWSNEDKKAVEEGIKSWKANKSGVQIASTTVNPWLDMEHRRYWIARIGDGNVIGILILTPIHGGKEWQIKNAVSFPEAPKGTSEALIYTALKDLHADRQGADINSTSDPTKEQATNGISEDEERSRDRVKVTFGISASKHLEPVENLGGWRINALSKTYKQVSNAAGLIRRGEFRNKFDSEPDPMYVCYPQDGFGLEGVNTLLKVLKK